MTSDNDNSIVVLGDFMLDCFIQVFKKSNVNINGKMPIFLVRKYNYMPGGAGTVARLLISRGLRVNCIGLIGNDWAGLLLLNALSTKNYQKYLFMEHINTRVRTYISDEERPFIRLDIEGPDKNTTFELIKKNMINVKIITDILAIDDFNKGCGNDYSTVVRAKKYTIVSVKNKNIDNYLNANILIVNAMEQIGCKKEKINEEDILRVINNVRKHGYLNELIVTCGSHGLYYESSDNKLYYFPSIAKHIKNPIGCGDTFVAGLLLGLANNEAILYSVSIGVYYAGFAAEYPGIALTTLSNIKYIDYKRKIQKVRIR